MTSILYNYIPDYYDDDRDLTKSSEFVPAMECNKNKELKELKEESKIKENFGNEIDTSNISDSNCYNLLCKIGIIFIVLILIFLIMKK